MLWSVFIALILAALAGIALVPLFLNNTKFLAGSLSFATGTLLAIVLGHVIPDVLSINVDYGLWLVAGFVLMMMLNHYLFHSDPCCDHDANHSHAHQEKLTLCTIGAMTVCTINDGFILGHQAVTLSHTLLWAMVAHKLTAAFGLYTMVRVCAQKKSWWHVVLLGFFVILTPVVYGLVAEKIIPPSDWMDVTLALSAGMLMYVVGVIFVPRCNEFGHKQPFVVILSLLAGILLTLFFAQAEHQYHDHSEVLPEAESHHHHDH